MVKKTYCKTLLRMFKGNLARFIAVSAILAVSAAVVTGIGSLSPRMDSAVGLLPAAGREGDMQYIGWLADKIEIISYVFPVFFGVIAVLVVFVTMARLAAEERSVTGCYKTLGYGRSQILARHMVFISAACLAGCGVGLVFGVFVLSPVLYAVISDQFSLPGTEGFFSGFGLISCAAMSAALLVTTFWINFRTAGEKPAALLLPKAPKAGRKIFLERLPFFWNRLKFKYKSTLRNIFRYAGRLVMTVFSVAGSTALVFCGLGLYMSLRYTNADVIDAISSISAALVICAVILSVLVIYNLTNMNIEERGREIATLKVLGYKNIEVTGYIYREVFLLALFGILAGLPIGYLFLRFLFDYMDFGSIDYVKWYVWIFTGLISLFASAFVDLLLFRKIHKTDMNASLKIAE
ncbi:MAG: ABC transporter permease [Clostridiales bacterium]|jgi:putative ABC transport system permease protein|nr:ABC transporter permease [Clostridiales bacterium]